MTFHSFVFSDHFILVSVAVDPERIPGILGVCVGIHPEEDASLSKSPVHTLTHSHTLLHT